MENVKIYLSGGMGGLTVEEQTAWRNKFQNAIKYNREPLKNPLFFSPPNFYCPAKPAEYQSEKEVMEFDLYNLRNSDIVVVNFNAPNSIGTAMELMLAKERHIPVIGLNDKGVELHPWLTECCTRICNTFVELVDHVVDFYLK